LVTFAAWRNWLSYNCRQIGFGSLSNQEHANRSCKSAEIELILGYIRFIVMEIAAFMSCNASYILVGANKTADRPRVVALWI